MRNKCAIRVSTRAILSPSLPKKEVRRRGAINWGWRNSARCKDRGASAMKVPFGTAHTTLTPTTGTCLEYNLLQLEFCGVSRGYPACSLYLATGTSYFSCLPDTRSPANNNDHSTTSVRQNHPSFRKIEQGKIDAKSSTFHRFVER